MKPNLLSAHLLAGDPLAGAALDRATHRRQDDEWLAEQWQSARILPVWRSRMLTSGGAAEPFLQYVSPDHPDLGRSAPIFLGLLGGEALFAVDLGDADSTETAFAPSQFLDLRVIGALLPADQAQVAAFARGMTWWHARHRYCGVCGTPTRVAEGGHRRVCLNADCASEHFPRTDPAVIVLVTDGDRALLARQPRFSPGMHSVLAGFVEPGESLEDAVAREVFEESAIRVGDIRYHSSQPWPFPSSLMLGFTARALTTELTFDGVELESGGWYSRETLRNVVPSEAFSLPNPISIARRLVDEWIAEG
jgi:NAD+ diphosphatase